MKESGTQKIVLTAVMAAVLCVLAPLSVPIGPVPISLATFVIFITVYVLGMKRGTLAVLIYLLIGLAGVPVFSGYSAGPAKLLGPTGGYLIGYIPMALITGAVIDRFSQKLLPSIGGMVVATVVLYALGTAWLAVSAHMTFGAALAAGVIPFVGLDFLKIVAAALAGPVLKKAMVKAGVASAAA